MLTQRTKEIEPRQNGEGFADWEHPIFDGPRPPRKRTLKQKIRQWLINLHDCTCAGCLTKTYEG